jgi:hypothetical protein
VNTKRAFLLLTLAVTSAAEFCLARDVGVVPLPFGQDNFNSSLLYTRVDEKDDFDARGIVRLKGNLVASEIGYSFLERSIISVRGGVLTEIEQSAQNAQWFSRAGYLFGAAFRHQVFPVTEYRPGLQLSASVSHFFMPLDRVDIAGSVSTIDHKVSGWNYTGRLLGQIRWWRLDPYAGLQGTGRSIRWRDHRPSAGSPAEVTGSAEGNISIVVGLPVRIRKDARLQIEGLFLNQTSLTAGFSISL